jgi:serine/threonine protein phosphatase PrpC
MKEGNKKIKNVGTCALCAIVYNNNIYVANSGDSKAIIVS